jgi:hypothetical protein
VELLRNGKGFTLQGQPTDGKSRTIYEVIRRMDGYHVVSPKLKDGLSHEDIGLLLKGRKIVLLLDDLTNYVGAGLDLRELGKSLNRNQVSWVVASTCRDGPQLESVRTAQTEGLGTFYENIPLKLKLLELTTAEKGLLAQNIGREWDSGEGEQYPTPGSITMENYKIYMHERFESKHLSPVQRDALRALKLLSRAGILPITHRQVAAVLEAERLFDWRDVHLQRDCLNGLRDNSFIRLAPEREVVQPEPAYLTDDVVPYTEGKEPEQDFDELMQILEHIQDATGLFFEICSKVVDCRFLEARGVPSQRVSWQSRRCNVGGKETPLWEDYIRMKRAAKNSPWTSTRSPVREHVGCSHRHWRLKYTTTSRRPEASATREAMPWW